MIRRFTTEPVLHGLAVLVAEKAGVACPLPPRTAESRRLDRYGRLGLAAAAGAFENAALSPPPRVDPAWGVMIGSSLGCLESNRLHDRAMRGSPLGEMSPALFVRTVSNSVTGDLSMAWRLGGPSETFVSGWTAGADALIAAAGALEEGRARWILAGAVESPGVAGSPGVGEGLREAAAMAILGAEPKPGALRLLAAGRGRAPDAPPPIDEAIAAVSPRRVASIVVTGDLPEASAWRSGAVDQRAGGLGSVGVFAAIEGAATAGGAVAIVVRGLAGEMAVVIAGR
jgi:beta-ketoacyl synthase-like protein